MMQTAQLKLTFLTPAFLGDAEQNARWRTPPIKHLLREWWRVEYFARYRDLGFSVSTMREAEGRLFGHAWLENDTYKNARGEVKPTSARQSLVRLRLLATDEKTDPRVVWGGETVNGVAPLDSRDITVSYAWFGLARRGRDLRDRQRIKETESRILALSWPDEHSEELQATLRLIHAFGTLGSRSRGGWGSVHLQGLKLLSAQDVCPYTQTLAQCLSRDWAAAIARDNDGRPWLWRSKQTFQSWNAALEQSARWRREVRTALKGPPNLRPALGFASPGRMPSPLRWKVVQDENAHLRLQVVAMPHRIPKEVGVSMNDADLQRAWSCVCQELDQRLDRAK